VKRALSVALAIVAVAAGAVAIAVVQGSPGVHPVLAAGNVARCHGDGGERTGRILAREPGTVLMVGNGAFPDGSARDYTRCYGPAWGAFRPRTRPVPGWRDYETKDAAAYRSYFSVRRTYYAFDLGSWRLYALDSERISRAELAWLRRDLATHAHHCVLAYWSRPLFSSGPSGDQRGVAPLWRLLVGAHADVILSGQDGDYEQFTRLLPNGDGDWTHGIREFVVGTGGATLAPRVRTTWRTNGVEWWTPGVLQLRLGRYGYGWRFLPANGTFVDEGGEDCR
jgi:hypothetical protein